MPIVPQQINVFDDLCEIRHEATIAANPDARKSIISRALAEMHARDFIGRSVIPSVINRRGIGFTSLPPGDNGGPARNERTR